MRLAWEAWPLVFIRFSRSSYVAWEILPAASAEASLSFSSCRLDFLIVSPANFMLAIADWLVHRADSESKCNWELVEELG